MENYETVQICKEMKKKKKEKKEEQTATSQYYQKEAIKYRNKLKINLGKTTRQPFRNSFSVSPLTCLKPCLLSLNVMYV